MKRKREESLVGRFVSIERNGADPRGGILLADQKDHLVLYNTQDGVVYYPKNHIGAITPNLEETAGENQLPDGSNQGSIEYLQGANILSVLASLRLTPVQFNRRSEDQVAGVLVEANRNEAVLVAGNEVTRIPLSSIRDIGDIENAQPEEEENSEPDNQSRRSNRRRNNRHSRR